MSNDHYVIKAGRLLDELARTGQTITYRDMAQQLGLSGPKKISQLSLILENIMSADVVDGRPLRAALVVSRVAPHMPRPGFFDHARQLGVLSDQDPALYHQTIVDALKSHA
jgi:hypothetical protein